MAFKRNAQESDDAPPQKLQKGPKASETFLGPLEPQQKHEQGESTQRFEMALADCAQFASNHVVGISKGQHPHTLDHPFLSRRDVILAISSVWATEYAKPDGKHLVYGPDKLFEFKTFKESEAVEKEVIPVGLGSCILLPLMLDDDHDTRRPHILPNDPAKKKRLIKKPKPLTALAVGRVTGSMSKPRLTFYHWNHHSNAGSRLAESDMKRLEDAAIAMLSRWPKSIKGGQGALIEKSVWRPCPTFAVDETTSTERIMLVLTAWAFIWNLTPKKFGRPLHTSSPQDSFYQHAREMVIFALQGRLQRSILQGYLEEQNYLDQVRSKSNIEPTDTSVADAEDLSVLVNSDIFTKILGCISCSNGATQPLRISSGAMSSASSSRQASQNPVSNGDNVHSRTDNDSSGFFGFFDKTVNFVRSASLSPFARGRQYDETRPEPPRTRDVNDILEESVTSANVSSFPKKLRKTPMININRTVRDWYQLYKDRIREYKQRYRGDAKKSDWIIDQDIDEAIAIVWYSLRWEGYAESAYPMTKAVNLCLSEDNLEFSRSWRFAGRDSGHMIMTLTGTGEDFTIPRTGDENLHRRKFATENNMHFLLAIVELTDPTRGDEVSITVFDSLGSHAAAFGRAQKFVENSGWLNIDSRGLAVKQPVFVRTRWRPKIPQQGRGGQCGLHAILNAWACLLDIPIIRSSYRFDEDLFDEYRGEPVDGYEELRWMIRLARAGLMDTLTIQAFMMSFGYCSKEFENSRREVAEISLCSYDGVQEIIASIEESAQSDWVRGNGGERQ